MCRFIIFRALFFAKKGTGTFIPESLFELPEESYEDHGQLYEETAMKRHKKQFRWHLCKS